MRFVNDIGDHYKLGKVLGSGKFGTVYKASRKNIGINCAVKSIPKDTVKSKDEISTMIGELEVLKKLSHHNTLEIMEILHDTKNFYIVSEECIGGELT